MNDEINIKMPGQILDYVDTKEHLLDLFNYITNLQELCNKYEEEHNTTFKEWQKDIQANKRAIEYIKQHTDKLTKIRVPKLDFNYENLLEILEENNEYNK